MADENRLSELKETIFSQGKLLKLPSANADLRRRCADLILQATQSFLFSWEKSSKIAPLPSGLIRDVFSLLLLELGPGDAHVRMWVVDTLPSLATTDGRQLLLDALPWFMAVETEQKEEATEIILAVFREILTKDPKALLPIIGCLSTLPLSERGRIEAWNVALASLPVVDECDLPMLVQSLLRNVTGNADAIKALHAIREETHLMESADGQDGTDQIPLVSLMVLNALMDRTQESLLCDAYSEILRQMTRQASNPRKSPGKESWSTTSFTLLDIMVLLLLYQHSKFKATIEKCVDDLLLNDSFPFQCLDTLLTIIVQGHKPGQPSSLLQDRLLPSVQVLVVYLLLAPVRINNLSVASLGDTGNIVLGLHRRLDRNRQEEVIRCMLHLSDECSQILSTETFGETARVKLRKRGELRLKRESLNATIETVHDILKNMAKSSPSTFSKFKHHLMERLTKESEVSTHAVSQVSELLAVLMEPSDVSHSGVDSQGVMMLLQKILFSSPSRQILNLPGSDNWNNDARITRGFILANELLKSSSLSLNDKDCLYQWVHLLLLPSNRRTIDPSIGGQGLKFLLTWKKLHNDHESHKVVFNDLKLIMANTGLVQMLSHYSQNGNPWKKNVLVYSKIPVFYSLPDSCVGNGKKRELVLCIDSFLRIRGISSPRGWFTEVQWVFDLVSSYLALGRDQTGTVSRNALQNAPQKKSGQSWTPDGWLEASIELPSLSNSLTMFTGVEEQTILLSAFAFDVPSARKLVDKKAAKEYVASLMKGRDGYEQNNLITGFLRFSSGVALAAGLSIAVLRNAYEHFLSVGFGTRGKKLIQYQLIKILDLKQKLMLLLTIFESISDTLGRLEKPEPVDKHGKGQCSDSKQELPPAELTDCEPNLPVLGVDTKSSSINPQLLKLKDDSDAAIKALTLIHDFLFLSTDSLISHGAIYESLTHFEDDDVLHRFLSSKELPIKLINVATMVINLRLDVLQHLNHNLGRNSQRQMFDQTLSRGDQSVMPSDAAYSRIMKMTSRLSLMVPKFRREHYTDVKDFEFALLNHLLVAYLTLCREHFMLHRDMFLSSFAQHFSVEVQPAGQAALIQNKDGHDQTLDQERTIRQILFHLHTCDDQVAANIFVDIVGLLALQDKLLVDIACDVCWGSLHTVYTIQSEDEAHTLPYSFLNATNAVFISNKKRTIESTKNIDSSTKALLASVVRASTNSSKDFCKNTMTRNALLILWALMIQPGCSEGRDHAFLSKMLDELENFLNSNSTRAHSGTRPCVKKQSIGKKENNFYISSLPGLSNSTIGFFFEMSVHLAVATLAIAPHAKPEIGDATAPFQHLPVYLQLFGRLLDLFGTYVNEFYRRSGVLIINSCHQILNLCNYHVIKCVDWRNAQPLLSPAERKLGKEDAGSIKHLDDLLKQVARDGVGRIALFCDRVVKGSQMGDTGGEPIDPGLDSKTWLCATYYRKIASLIQSTEKTMLSLRSVASAHNLVPPKAKINWSAATLSARNNGKLNVRGRGFHEISSKTATELYTLQNDPKKKKRRVTLVLMKDDIEESLCLPKKPEERGPLNTLINSDEEILEAESDTHSNGNSSDGFGVAGGWGEEELSANDDASLTLESNRLFDNS